MEMRELSLAEVKMVSGAGACLPECEKMQTFAQELKNIVDFATFLNPKNPQMIITNFAPLRDIFINLLDGYGFDGKAAIASWK